MSKKRRPPSEIQNAIRATESQYVTWEDGNLLSKNRAMKTMNNAVEEYTGFTTASYRQSFENVGGTGISGRRGLTHEDYALFRPHEAKAKTSYGLKIQCDLLYRNIGIVKNVIDLMGDFTSQGIRLVHPNPRIERFYQSWWHKVHGSERSERFCNILYRLGTVVVRKQTAMIHSNLEQDMMNSRASDITIEMDKINKREIPWKYNFLHPANVIMVGGELGNFVGTPTYALIMPSRLTKALKNASSSTRKQEMDMLSKIPKEIRQAIEHSTPIVLDKNKVSVWDYKKDDWQEFGDPMIGAIIEDLALLQKLKLADKAALDGAISNIRIIKLGNLEHKIAPTRAAAAKLAEILQSNTGAGTFDLIWGPDIDMIESATTVHQFLGEDKYKPTLINIYAGLGIPPTLTGTFGAAGTTNNFISLKTLTQRLEYGRERLVHFWQNEVEAVQKAMGFRFPAKVEFDIMNLGDEESEKNLLIKLYEHNLISDELVQFKLGIDPHMEKIRLNREQRERDAGRMVPKSGAWHDPQFGLALKKAALMTGVVTPNQVGLREDEPRKDMKLYPKGKGEKNALELRAKTAPGSATTKKKGTPGQGRPPGKKDSQKRKPKTFKPKTRAAVEIWAHCAQEAISEFVNHFYLDMVGKKNMRGLSNDQSDTVEELKFGVLCNLEPLSEISDVTIHKAMDCGIPATIKETYNAWTNQVRAEIKRELTLEERKHLQAAVYAAATEMDEEDGTN